MTTFTWNDVLSAIREGKQTIPTAPNGIPLVAVNTPFYELMQLMEALTSGYNALVDRDADNKKRIELVRKLAQERIERVRKQAQAAFPAEADRAVPADGWISVDDMLPPRSGQYMTYDTKSPYRGVYPLEYSAKHGKFNATDSQDAPIHAIEVTHWHMRPQPPVVE